MAGLDACAREGLIAHLGVTNFDTDHLRVLVKQGFPVVYATRSRSRCSIGAPPAP